MQKILDKHNLNIKVVAWDEFRGDGHYIINSDPSGSPGRHWMGLYNSTPIEFFDPTGHSAKYYDLDDRLPNSYTYNKTKVQGPISVRCGEYCIYYLYLRIKGHSMIDIVKSLDNEYYVNDSIVCEFVNKLK